MPRPIHMHVVDHVVMEDLLRFRVEFEDVLKGPTRKRTQFLQFLSCGPCHVDYTADSPACMRSRFARSARPGSPRRNTWKRPAARIKECGEHKECGERRQRRGFLGV